MEVLASHLVNPIANPEVLITRPMSHFQYFDDPVLEYKCLDNS
jgi:hypothetical protein